MSDAPVRYRKLPGAGFGWSGRSRLWLAEDHLVEVNSTTFTERYRRFFLSDIRAVLVERTKVGFFWNLVLGGLGLAGAGVAGLIVWGANSLKDEEFRMGLWILAGIVGAGAAVCLVLLLINALLGTTCRCHLQTSAGLQALEAPRRVRGARRMLAKLAPIIEAVQSAPPGAQT